MSRSLAFPFARLTVATGLLVGPSLLAFPSAAAAQSASEILDRALQHYEQRAEGIDNYTVVQSTEGFLAGNTMTMYYEKTMVDGHPVFVVHNSGMDSIARMQERSGANRSAAETLRIMKDHASLEGSDVVDGHDCWILNVDDPASLTQLQGKDSEASMTLESMKMCLDKEDYVPRRLTMDGKASIDGKTHPITFTSLLSDYRNVEGLLHPFRTEVTMSGMSSGSMSPEDREKTRKQLAEAKAQIAKMPEAQRGMMEKMMGGQLEKLEQMLADDALTFTFLVQDVKVNAGPPSE